MFFFFSQIPNTPSRIPITPYPILIPVSLPFLYFYSIIGLIQAHKPVLDIVLGKTVWSKLIKKVCQGIRKKFSSLFMIQKKADQAGL